MKSMHLSICLLSLGAAFQTAKLAQKARTSPLRYDKEDAMAEMLEAQHALKLQSVAEAKEEVYAQFAGRLEALEHEIACREGTAPAELCDVPIYSSAPAAPAAAPAAERQVGAYESISPEQLARIRAGDASVLAAPAVEKPAEAPPKAVRAPGTELTFLEYAETPPTKFKPTEPLTATVESVKRAIGPNAPGEISHVVLRTGHKFQYVEGQSIGVLPPGTDPKNGKPYQQRLYSIASSRYGDDGAGTSVSLCVRRAVYVDPETGEEDPAKKGVCSNWLCDARPGQEVPVTGPVGKGMLLPEDDAADIIMVATGTGVAPYRGFVSRLFTERTPAAAAFEGRAWLFFGGPTTDSILYPELWEAARAAKPDQFRLTLAISREQTNPAGGRLYVQDRITEHAEELFERMANGAHLYLCGLKGMQPGIEAALQAAAEARGLVFKDWIKALKKEKRYHVEVY